MRFLLCVDYEIYKNVGKEPNTLGENIIAGFG